MRGGDPTASWPAGGTSPRRTSAPERTASRLDAGILRAHYDDTYVSTDDGWLFASRELVIHYSGPPDLSAPFLNTHERLGDGSV